MTKWNKISESLPEIDQRVILKLKDGKMVVAKLVYSWATDVNEVSVPIDCQKDVQWFAVPEDIVEENILPESIDDLGMTVRSTNILKGNGVLFVNQLCNLTEDDLSKFPNMGKKSLTEIKRVLDEHGLYLGRHIDIEIAGSE